MLTNCYLVNSKDYNKSILNELSEPLRHLFTISVMSCMVKICMIGNCRTVFKMDLPNAGITGNAGSFTCLGPHVEHDNQI
jgi:hypothetical protein